MEKKTDEIEGIIEELEVHLFEAERNDKSVEHIIGRSPKEYMKLLSDEMPVDFRGWLKYILMILFGALSYLIIDKVLNGGIEVFVFGDHRLSSGRSSFHISLYDIF
ncbi:hypothetical protein RCO48_23725 [Peribacillus frigoritolerans]|nr:hypothetical protein [Peribacillus frigoritolerans]